MIKARTLKRTGKKVHDVRLRDPNGVVYTRTFATRKEAEAFQWEERLARRRGSWIDPRLARRAFAPVARDWLDGDSMKRPSSAARDRSILDTHILPAIGSKAVGAITRADVERLVRAWSSTHAPSSVGRMYSTLRAVYAFAESSDLVARTPCRDIRLPRVELVERPTLSAENLEALAAELEENQAVMMWTGAVLGLRWAEAAGLTVDAVDVMRGQLSVSVQLGRDGVLGLPKSSAGRRTMAMPLWLSDEFAALMARRGLTAADGDALLFVSAGGTPLHYANWRRRVWAPACERAGLSGLRFHDLRSLAATALVAEGVDVKTAQTRLGHSSPQVTLALYARATREGDRDAAERVGARFRPRDGRAMKPRRPTTGSER